MVSFASNDYLGLSQHPAVKAAASDAVERWGAGSGSARLIVGDRPPHRDLEEELAAWKETEAAVILPTGFAANLAVLTTFGTAGVLLVSDELNHASIIDGGRLSRADVAIARHADPGHVDALLDAAMMGPRWSSTDTVFSMDGDTAPLAELLDVCAAHGALLVLDEAHAVLGPEEPALPDGGHRVLRVGTQSKTLGALGGFVAGPRAYVDLVINAARSFIFTTAPSPADAAAAATAVRILRSTEGAALVARLRTHVERIAPGHPSPIVPIVIGAEADAVAASQRLLDDHGLLVPAIRPPTVAPGTSRLRIALSAAHSDDEVERLAKAPGAFLPSSPHGAQICAHQRTARMKGVITVLCVGTATEVGKTWVGAQVLGALREAGVKVAARKPVQSFDPDDTHPTDAAVLAGATGEDVHTVCPESRWLPLPMAPPIAAVHLARDLGLLADLVQDMAPLLDPDCELVWFETVGGVRSPMADDGDSADLARWVQPDHIVLGRRCRPGHHQRRAPLGRPVRRQERPRRAEPLRRDRRHPSQQPGLVAAGGLPGGEQLGRARRRPARRRDR